MSSRPGTSWSRGGTGFCVRGARRTGNERLAIGGCTPGSGTPDVEAACTPGSGPPDVEAACAARGDARGDHWVRRRACSDLARSEAACVSGPVVAR